MRPVTVRTTKPEDVLADRIVGASVVDIIGPDDDGLITIELKKDGLSLQLVAFADPEGNRAGTFALFDDQAMPICAAGGGR